MLISYKWLTDYIQIDLPIEEVSEILTQIGLEVEGLEKKTAIKGGLEGIVIGKVVSCEKHTNADKLSVTTVDVGKDELLNIVCGAPNVAEGQKVVVATVGTVLYSGDDSFKIQKRKVRGEVSEGMICAEDEIGLGQGHDGIMVLEANAKIGEEAKVFFNLEDDYIIDIGLTPNRADATNHIGVAKDFAAALKVRKGIDSVLKLPNVDRFKSDNKQVKIKVVVEDKEGAPRFAGVCLSDIKVGPSPNWMQEKLRAIGLSPINNVVDITNFVLKETGQPLHAYDYDKIDKQTIRVKNLPSQTPFKGLDGTDFKLNAEDLMICDGNDKPMCMAGVFGGADSGVTVNTERIFLEAAYFNASTVRKSMVRHNLRTDAAFSFEKGVDPNNVIYALKRAALLMKELAGAKISSDIVDISQTGFKRKHSRINLNEVRAFLGIDIVMSELKTILDALDMEIINQTRSSYTFLIPTNKPDVYRKEDVMEEIIRIYGLDKIKVSNTVQSILNTEKVPNSRGVYNKIANMLVGKGFVEFMGLSLTKSQYFDGIFNVPDEELVFINNTSNKDLNVMRPNMMVSGMEVIGHNLNRKNNNLSLFEFGKTFRKDGTNFKETSKFMLYLVGNYTDISWDNKKLKPYNFYHLKSNVLAILQILGINKYKISDLDNHDFEFGLSFDQGPNNLVEFGLMNSDICKKMGVSQPVYCAIIDWNTILMNLRKPKIVYKPISKFPKVKRDLAFVIDKNISFKQIEDIIRKQGKPLVKEITLFDIYDNEEHLGKGKKSYSVSYCLEDSSKTLKQKEIDKIMNKVISACEKQLNAIIRR